jgi:N-acetylglutamate synthase-like GNAT family acetyltransferase
MDNIIYKKLETEEEIFLAKNLILEYIKWLNADLAFQNIEDELKNFPKKYKPPEGEFIIAKENGNVIGCVAIKKLENKICEMKRLFVKDEYKKMGIGRTLVEKIIDESRIKNYERIRLDTLETMEDALKIYYKNGFYEIKPYYNNPNSGIVYLEKIL